MITKKIKNTKWILGTFLFIFTFAFIFTWATPSHAFHEDKEKGLEIRGFFKTDFFYTEIEKDDTPFHIDDEIYGNDTTFRLILDKKFLDDEIVFKANLMTRSLAIDSDKFDVRPTGTDIERSSSLFYKNDLHDHSYVYTVFDVLNIGYTFGNMDITLGRQVINYATTYLFTPNDFFAPFSATDYYRTFKGGVDAIRMTLNMGQFTTLDYVGVLTYKQDLTELSGFVERPTYGDTSHILRVVTSVYNSEISAFGGRYKDLAVYGGGLQTEIPYFGLALKAEGHIEMPEDKPRDSETLYTIHLSRIFDNSLNITAEYFYNGLGYDDSDKYFLYANKNSHMNYPGLYYLALSAGYDVTPIDNVQITLLKNLTDGSSLLNLYNKYSLSDESDLFASLSIPFGDGYEFIGSPSPRQEYGASPVSFLVEYRLFF